MCLGAFLITISSGCRSVPAIGDGLCSLICAAVLTRLLNERGSLSLVMNGDCTATPTAAFANYDRCEKSGDRFRTLSLVKQTFGLFTALLILSFCSLYDVSILLENCYFLFIAIIFISIVSVPNCGLAEYKKLGFRIGLLGCFFLAYFL